MPMIYKTKKRYLIQTNVEIVEGTQTWWVDACSPEEAMKRYHAGEGDIYTQDLDVMHSDHPEVVGETTLDDLGDYGENDPSLVILDALVGLIAQIEAANKCTLRKPSEWQTPAYIKAVNVLRKAKGETQ